MSTIVTRSGKGSPLSHVEVDANFSNLNTDKIQSGNTVAALTITSATINGGAITGITDLAIADGGTGSSSAPQANATLRGWTTTATAAGTTTLTNSSSYQQEFTGSTTQTVVMPVTSTLALGWSFEITNNSTGTLTIQSSGLNTIGTVTAGTTASIVCVAITGTTAASWDFDIDGFASETGTGSVVRATSPTLVTPALGTPSSGTLTNCTFPTLNQNTTGTAAGLSATLAVASGGTGVTTSTGSGNNVLSTSPTLVTPVLGTPTSGALTNCTSIPVNQATGTLPVANGGTGLTSTPANGALDIGNGTGFTRTTLTQGSGITITNASGSITIASSGGSGTVTSVATGNGLSGGTITSTGTLIIACPTFNSIGSYASVAVTITQNVSNTVTGGTNYSAGTSNGQVSGLVLRGIYDIDATMRIGNSNTLSGTWKWMGGTKTVNIGCCNTSCWIGIACRTA
jgi:hypothetical protein